MAYAIVTWYNLTNLSLLEQGGNPAIETQLNHPCSYLTFYLVKIMIAVDIVYDLAYALTYANIRR